MDNERLVRAFEYLAKTARLNEHEKTELMDIVCDHDFKNWNDGYGNDWMRCIKCGNKEIEI